MQLTRHQVTDIATGQLLPAEPLWKRVPTRNAEGRMLSDFMMIIPKLRESPAEMIQRIVHEIELVLTYYSKQVVFADLNLKINVLWVSVQPIPGIITEVAAAIHHRVPTAKLVAHKTRT